MTANSSQGEVPVGVKLEARLVDQNVACRAGLMGKERPRQIFSKIDWAHIEDDRGVSSVAGVVLACHMEKVDVGNRFPGACGVRHRGDHRGMTRPEASAHAIGQLAFLAVAPHRIEAADGMNDEL